MTASPTARSMPGWWSVAVGETVILLHPPLPLVGVSIAMERESVSRMTEVSPPAAQVEAMDSAVGVVLGSVDQLGLADRTVVVFTSDNGVRPNTDHGPEHWPGSPRIGVNYRRCSGGVSSGDAFATSNLPLRGGKGRHWEGDWAMHVNDGSLYLLLEMIRANRVNDSLYLLHGMTWEGGVRVPLYIKVHPPLPLLGVSIWMERESVSKTTVLSPTARCRGCQSRRAGWRRPRPAGSTCCRRCSTWQGCRPRRRRSMGSRYSRCS